jgi:hypothetical protein
MAQRFFWESEHFEQSFLSFVRQYSGGALSAQERQYLAKHFFETQHLASSTGAVIFVAQLNQAFEVELSRFHEQYIAGRDDVGVPKKTLQRFFLLFRDVVLGESGWDKNINSAAMARHAVDLLLYEDSAEEFLAFVDTEADLSVLSPLSKQHVFAVRQDLKMARELAESSLSCWYAQLDGLHHRAQYNALFRDFSAKLSQLVHEYCNVCDPEDLEPLRCRISTSLNAIANAHSPGECTVDFGLDTFFASIDDKLKRYREAALEQQQKRSAIRQSLFSPDADRIVLFRLVLTFHDARRVLTRPEFRALWHDKLVEYIQFEDEFEPKISDEDDVMAWFLGRMAHKYYNQFDQFMRASRVNLRDFPAHYPLICAAVENLTCIAGNPHHLKGAIRKNSLLRADGPLGSIIGILKPSTDCYLDAALTQFRFCLMSLNQHNKNAANLAWLQTVFLIRAARGFGAAQSSHDDLYNLRAGKPCHQGDTVQGCCRVSFWQREIGLSLADFEAEADLCRQSTSSYESVVGYLLSFAQRHRLETPVAEFARPPEKVRCRGP